MDCIFCKIINKELPSVVLYDDEDFIVILDKFPQTKGHSLIIPKAHSQDMFDIDDRLLEKMLKLAKLVAVKLKKVVNFEGINVVQCNGAAAGQTVFHYHMHLVPAYKDARIQLDVKHAKEGTLDELCAIRDAFCSL